MTRTTWDEQEFPFLERLSREPRLEGVYPIYEYASMTLGLSDRETTDMIKDLTHDDYVAGGFLDDGGHRFAQINGLRLAPAGRRFLGLWPRDESGAESLVAAMVAELDARIAAAGTNDEERSKLRAVLSTLGGAGRDIAVSVLTEVAKRQTGLG